MKRRTFLALAAGMPILLAHSPALAGQDAIEVARLARYIPEGGSGAGEQGAALARKIVGIFADMGANAFTVNGERVVRIPERALFLHPSSAIDPAAMPRVTEMAKALHAHPKTWIDIIGHYHSDGRPAHALTRSARRAVSLQAALMSRKVAIERLRTSGLGEAWPIASNSSPEGQSSNRRIEIVVHS